MPENYLAVADVKTGDSLLLEQSLESTYVSLQDIYVAYYQGTLDQYGIDPDTFSLLKSMSTVFNYLGQFSASHWMDQSLWTEFWMKNYDEV